MVLHWEKSRKSKEKSSAKGKLVACAWQMAGVIRAPLQGHFLPVQQETYLYFVKRICETLKEMISLARKDM